MPMGEGESTIESVILSLTLLEILILVQELIRFVLEELHGLPESIPLLFQLLIPFLDLKQSTTIIWIRNTNDSKMGRRKRRKRRDPKLTSAQHGFTGSGSKARSAAMAEEMDSSEFGLLGSPRHGEIED